METGSTGAEKRLVGVKVAYRLLPAFALLTVAIRCSRADTAGLGATATWPPPLVPTRAVRLPEHETLIPRPATAAPGSPVQLEPDPGQSWRFGFGVADTADPGFWAPRLGGEWYLDWAVVERGPGQAPVHWQMVRVSEGGLRPGLETIHRIAEDYPGAVWVIGNESDVIWQDNTRPERYAELYRQAYAAIKEADPSARVAVGAVAQVTPMRLAYLDRVLAAYEESGNGSLPADLWTVHIYVLREERGSWGVDIPPGFDEDEGALYEVGDHGRIDLFESQVRSFRAWMAQHGYRDVPLALTEFGILMPNDYGFPPEDVARYMQDTFSLLLALRDPATGLSSDDHRLVQQWAWFSLASTDYPTSDLADLQRRQLTPLGTTYRDYIRGIEAAGGE